MFVPQWLLGLIEYPGQHAEILPQCPYLVARVEGPAEKRGVVQGKGRLDIDEYGVTSWLRLGHGTYAWWAQIGGRRLPWIMGEQAPETNHKVLILMEKPFVSPAMTLLPGRYLGRCIHEEGTYQWRLKSNRILPSGYPDEYFKVSSKHLYWLPLPVNDR